MQIWQLFIVLRHPVTILVIQPLPIRQNLSLSCYCTKYFFDHRSIHCCVFRPANGCSAHRLLVKIDFLMQKLTEENNGNLINKVLDVKPLASLLIQVCHQFNQYWSYTAAFVLLLTLIGHNIVFILVNTFPDLLHHIYMSRISI